MQVKINKAMLNLCKLSANIANDDHLSSRQPSYFRGVGGGSSLAVIRILSWPGHGTVRLLHILVRVFYLFFFYFGPLTLRFGNAHVLYLKGLANGATNESDEISRKGSRLRIVRGLCDLDI